MSKPSIPLKGPHGDGVFAPTPEFIERNQIRTRGKGVHDGTRMQYALAATAASAALADADREPVLREFRRQPDLSASLDLLVEMCSRLAKGEPLDAFAIAAYLERSGDEATRARFEHYDRQVRLLSPAAQRVYEEALNGITDVSLRSAAIDYVGLAQDAPEYVGQVRRNCPKRLASLRWRADGGIQALPLDQPAGR